MTAAKTETAPPRKRVAAPETDRRTHGLVPAAMVAGKVTRPIFGRHGFASGALITDWPAIVGSAIATYAMPVRITFPPKERVGGTLVVKVASSAFAPQLQHLEPLVIERINGYFGYGAVARLRLVHGPLPERKTRFTPPKPDPNAPLPPILQQVDDPELRACLERLARCLARP